MRVCCFRVMTSLAGGLLGLLADEWAVRFFPFVCFFFFSFVCVFWCGFFCSLFFSSLPLYLIFLCFFCLIATFANSKVDDPSLCLSVCLSVCLCAPRKRFLRNCSSHHRQTWHGDCLRHDNASCFNYIDFNRHSRSHIY